MTILQAYLNRSETQKVLSRKPGQEGFSLIELVVVVAVLAILAAIAIPSFTSINDKAKASAAMNTLAQIAKECAVKDANNETKDFNLPNLSGYSFGPTTAQVTENCDGSSDLITATSDSLSKYPTYQYNVVTGKKICNHSGSDAKLQGCSAKTNGTW